MRKEIVYPTYKVDNVFSIKWNEYYINKSTYYWLDCYFIKYNTDIDISNKVKWIVYVKENNLRQYIIARDLETLNKAIYYLRLLN